MKKQKYLGWIALCAAAAWLSTEISFADELGDKGRAIFNKHQQSVATVQIVLKSKISMSGMGGQSNESRQNATGTVIDPSGLTVLSLSGTDPGQMVQNIMSSQEGRLKVDTELSDIKILMKDGTEIPAEVVLRDKDLDLAFVRPTTKPASPFQAIDLADSSKVDVLDQVITLNRLGNAAGRAYSASVERISAVVPRPRVFYVPDASMTTTALGSPAFSLDGKVVGIFVMRAMKGGNTGPGMFSLQPENYTGIILPAEQVLKAAKQAPAAGTKSAETQEKKADEKQ